MKLNEAITAREKMLAFESGTRKENVKACNNDKLLDYQDICIHNNFSIAGRALEDEILSRGLIPVSLCAFTPVAAAQWRTRFEVDFVRSLANYLAQANTPQWFTECLINLSAITDQAAANQFLKKLGRINSCLAIMLAMVHTPQIVPLLKNYIFEPKLFSEGPYFEKSQLKRIIEDASNVPAILHTLADTKPATPIAEAVEKHTKLNPSLWTGTAELRPEVRKKIFNIVSDFIDGLAEDGIKFNLKDIVLVGSNCSYNYNKDSDLDIHLRLSTKGFVCPDDLYPQLYSAYRSLFNKKHDISFYGIPVEIFVETAFDRDDAAEQKLNSAGVYSVLFNRWLKKPEPAAIPEIDQNELDQLVAPWAERYLQIKYKPTIEAVDQYITDIYELRRAGIAVSEFDLRNLVFKEIRSRGYLDTLKDLKDKLVSREYSLK